jgi:hypothetical protein
MLRHSNLIAFSLGLYPFKSCEAYGAGGRENPGAISLVHTTARDVL